jgi:hypothetical protein
MEKQQTTLLVHSNNANHSPKNQWHLHDLKSPNLTMTTHFNIADQLKTDNTNIQKWKYSNPNKMRNADAENDTKMITHHSKLDSIL